MCVPLFVVCLVVLQRVLAGLDVGIGGFDRSVLEVVGARGVGRGSRRVKIRIGIGVGGDPRWNSLEDLSGYCMEWCSLDRFGGKSIEDVIRYSCRRAAAGGCVCHSMVVDSALEVVGECECA